jgi:hypothetical protein
MSIKKTLVGAAAVVAIVAPLFPDKININLNVPITVGARQEKPYEVVSTTCVLTDTFVDQRGHQVCEYTCTEGDYRKVSKITFNSGAMCQSNIRENVKRSKR